MTIPDLAAVAPDVPFLSDFGRAIGLIDTDPYGEIARYLKIHRDQVGAALGTLSYFRRRDPRPAGDVAGAVLGRAHGRDL